MLEYSEDIPCNQFEVTYGDDDDTSDSSIDYPDRDEVYWSDEDEHEFSVRESYNESVDGLRRSNITFPFPIHSRRSELPFIGNDVVLARWGAECSICLQPLNPNTRELYCSSSCGNVFHTSCIAEYKGIAQGVCGFGVAAKCPLCQVWSKFDVCGAVESIKKS